MLDLLRQLGRRRCFFIAAPLVEVKTLPAEQVYHSLEFVLHPYRELERHRSRCRLLAERPQGRPKVGVLLVELGHDHETGKSAPLE